MMEAHRQARLGGQIRGDSLAWIFLLFWFYLFVYLFSVFSWAHSSSLKVRWRDPKNNEICSQRSVNPGPGKIKF